MGVNAYDVGDVVRLTGTFAVGGTNTDPSTVTLYVEDPSGNVDTYTYAATVTKSAEGIFTYDLAIDEAGTWSYRWVGTGAAAAVEQRRLFVREQLAVSS
ncbi:MAG: hypothetical protein ACPHCN_18695 [Mycobacterium sp.]